VAILSRQIKAEVFNSIIQTPSFLGKYEEYDGILTFLNKIWDLKEMPSTDSRFKNAYEDANQHIVNNSDWSIEYLFTERLNLIDGEESKFVIFLETVVNPTVRKNKDEILLFVSKINNIIQVSGHKLIITDYFEELPVYKFKDSTKLSDLPIDIIENKIPIYLSTSKEPIEYPSFVLSYDRWNDYGLVTMFDLAFRADALNSISLGKVKIMKRDTNSTWETFPEKFTSLPSDYCSLGQKKEYYQRLKYNLTTDYYSFLLGIRDAAIFPKIHEQFENDDIFKTSLIRDNEVERLARTIRFEIEGINPNEYFKFNYSYQPPYAENTIALNFDFEYNTDFEHRIYAIIGKNGTGKTRILSSLAKSLSQKEPQSFSPRKPIYGKVFTVSYSFFDRFDIPSSDASFNYVYCGLKKGKNEWKTEEDMLADFYKSVELIKKKGLENDWYKTLISFIVPEILDVVFDKEEDFINQFNYKFNEHKFPEISKMLSSGQSIILFLISEILSQIRYDSLILFDEPETHLHPNAISSLLNTLFSLVKRFKSFCVLATHSPLIVQEIPARNIFILEREENTAFVRELERESFGENLTIITQDIFGNREVPRHFIALIEELISKGKSYAEIVSILETDQLPITSNIRLYIKTLLPK
jgi:predicted ATPase